jgi:hypothetical protein
MTLLLKLFQPYAFMILGMTYSVQQALEGLNINSTQFTPMRDQHGAIIGSALDVNASLALPFLAVLVFLVVWLILWMLALRALWGRRSMSWGLLLLLLPGVLSLTGVWPQVHWLPRRYDVGSGYVGGLSGMLLLQVAAMSTGWALTVLLTCRLKLDDRFRHGYDQFWYALAISAGLFFVADLNANGQRDDLRQSAATSRAASGYLLDQTRRLEAACESGTVRLPLACQWAGNSQWQLEEYAHESERLYWQLGPELEWRVYTGSNSAPDDRAVDALRQELRQYNSQVCPVTDLGGGASQTSRVSRVCQTTPPDFCTAFPARRLPGVDPSFGLMQPMAIANECVAPTLYRLRIEQASLASSVGDNDKARHLRTMFFVFVAFIAGGKVANASVRMTEAIRKARAGGAAQVARRGPGARIVSAALKVLALIWVRIKRFWSGLARLPTK